MRERRTNKWREYFLRFRENQIRPKWWASNTDVITTNIMRRRQDNAITQRHAHRRSATRIALKMTWICSSGLVLCHDGSGVRGVMRMREPRSQKGGNTIIIMIRNNDK